MFFTPCTLDTLLALQTIAAITWFAWAFLPLVPRATQ